MLGSDETLRASGNEEVPLPRRYEIFFRIGVCIACVLFVHNVLVNENVVCKEVYYEFIIRFEGTMVHVASFYLRLGAHHLC